MWKNAVYPDGPQMTTCYGARAFHAGQLRLQTHTQNTQYLLLLYGNKINANAPQCYFARTFPVLKLYCSLRISRQIPG